MKQFYVQVSQIPLISLVVSVPCACFSTNLQGGQIWTLYTFCVPLSRWLRTMRTKLRACLLLMNLEAPIVSLWLATVFEELPWIIVNNVYFAFRYSRVQSQLSWRSWSAWTTHESRDFPRLAKLNSWSDFLILSETVHTKFPLHGCVYSGRKSGKLTLLK